MQKQSDDEKIKKLIDERVKVVIAEYLKTAAFTDRKLTDTPTDDFMVTPRKYVNMFGSVTGRPTGSVVGQQYFDTDLGYPIFKNQNTRWTNSVGSVVG